MLRLFKTMPYGVQVMLLSVKSSCSSGLTSRTECPNAERSISPKQRYHLIAAGRKGEIIGKAGFCSNLTPTGGRLPHYHTISRILFAGSANRAADYKRFREVLNGNPL